MQPFLKSLIHGRDGDVLESDSLRVTVSLSYYNRGTDCLAIEYVWIPGVVGVWIRREGGDHSLG